MFPEFDRGLPPEQCLAETPYVDAHSPPVLDTVAALGVASRSPVERAAAVFSFVRDRIRYNFSAPRDPDAYVASRILTAGTGFCVQKALVACALGRAAGIPTALVLADLRDRSLSPAVIAALGTDIMFHHGLTAFHLDGAWRVADASLSPDLVARKRYRRVDFDGRSDALIAPTSADGLPHAEYLKIHGLYADLPYDQMIAAFAAGYCRADAHVLAKMGLGS